MEEISNNLSILRNGGRGRNMETHLHINLADMFTLFTSGGAIENNFAMGGADNAHSTRIVSTTFGDIPPCLNQHE